MYMHNLYLGCIISGCEECQDRNYVCEDCDEELIPTLDQYSCGSKLKHWSVFIWCRTNARLLQVYHGWEVYMYVVKLLVNFRIVQKIILVVPVL